MRELRQSLMCRSGELSNFIIKVLLNVLDNTVPINCSIVCTKGVCYNIFFKGVEKDQHNYYVWNFKRVY